MPGQSHLRSGRLLQRLGPADVGADGRSAEGRGAVGAVLGDEVLRTAEPPAGRRPRVNFGTCRRRRCGTTEVSGGRHPQEVEVLRPHSGVG